MTRSEGFAIVEILLAVVVVTVVATGLLGGERNGSAVARQGIEDTAALALMEARLDELRADPDAIPVGPHEVDCASPLLADARGTADCRLVEPGLLEIELRVRWRSAARGDEVERALTTWIAREVGR